MTILESSTPNERVIEELEQILLQRPIQQPAAVVDHQPGPGPLDGLMDLLKAGPRPPEVGVAAAQAMRQCFEAAASDIEKIAAEGVESAKLVEQEAKSFAAIIREHGENLCKRVEDQSARTRQVSLVLREVAKLIAEPAAPTAA